MASFATLGDLATYAVAPKAFAAIADDQKQAQLDAASTLGEGYLADQFHLPIKSPFPVDLRMNVCQIAAFYLMSSQGYRPGGADDVIRQRYDDALKWFRDIATGIVTPAGIVDSSAGGREGGPGVITGALGNVVGGDNTVQPTNTLGNKPYAFSNTISGRRGW